MSNQTVSGFYCDWHRRYESEEPAMLARGRVGVCKEALAENTTEFWDSWIEAASKQLEGGYRQPPTPVLVEKTALLHLVYSSYVAGTITISRMLELLNVSHEEARSGLRKWLDAPGNESARKLWSTVVRDF